MSLSKQGVEGFNKLCEDVGEIDKEARYYLEKCYKGWVKDSERGLNFAPRNCLIDCMVWSKTPQGYNYWASLSDRVDSSFTFNGELDSPSNNGWISVDDDLPNEGG